jgi:hypothetical protein
MIATLSNSLTNLTTYATAAIAAAAVTIVTAAAAAINSARKPHRTAGGRLLLQLVALERGRNVEVSAYFYHHATVTFAAFNDCV